jgi:hypothetical protein
VEHPAPSRTIYRQSIVRSLFLAARSATPTSMA